MKTLLMAASALSLLAAPAMAQVGPSTVDINSSVTPACGLDGALAGSVKNFTMPIGADGKLAPAAANAFAGNMIDTAENLFGTGDVWCNGAATIKVTGTPLLHSSLPLQNNHARPAAGEFTGILDLNLRVSASEGFKVGGVAFPAGRLNTGAGLDVTGPGMVTGTAEVTSGGAFQGGVEGALYYWGGETNRFLAGTYRSQWTLTVTAN